MPRQAQDGTGAGAKAPEMMGSLRAFELALVGASNSFHRWVATCAGATGTTGLGSTDLLILKMVSRETRPKRAAELAFALSLEDVHVVTYALKKLGAAEFVRAQRIGKESHFSTTDAGEALLKRYDEIRTACLLNVLGRSGKPGDDLPEVTERLLVLSGFYEQAARTAAGL